MSEVDLLELELSSSLSFPPELPPLVAPAFELLAASLDFASSADNSAFFSNALDSGAPPLLWVDSLALGLSLIQRGPRCGVVDSGRLFGIALYNVE